MSNHVNSARGQKDPVSVSVLGNIEPPRRRRRTTVTGLQAMNGVEAES